MGVNKVEYAGKVLIDLTSDTVTADSLTEGEVAHGANGESIIGTNPYEKKATDSEVNTQATLIAQIKTALDGKTAGGGGDTTVDTCTVKIALLNDFMYTAMDCYFLALENGRQVVKKATIICSVNDSYEEKEVLETDILKLEVPDYIAKYVREKYFYSKDGELILRLD
jgi:hypothetical protein